MMSAVVFKAMIQPLEVASKAKRQACRLIIVLGTMLGQHDELQNAKTGTEAGAVFSDSIACISAW